MNNKPIILDVAEKHLEEILKLNQDLVHFLSDLDMTSLTELGNMADTSIEWWYQRIISTWA